MKFVRISNAGDLCVTFYVISSYFLEKITFTTYNVATRINTYHKAKYGYNVLCTIGELNIKDTCADNGFNMVAAIKRTLGNTKPSLAQIINLIN